MSDEVGEYIALLARDAARRKALTVYWDVVHAALEQPQPTPALRAALARVAA